MDTATELTCPECDAQQANAEECAYCGASLLSSADDIPTMQGKKSVSAPWPTQTSPASTSSAPTTKVESDDDVFPFEEPLPDSAESGIDSENDATTIGQPPTSTNWQPTRVGNNEKPVVEHSELPISDQDALSEQDLFVSQEQTDEKQQSYLDSSDSTISDKQSDEGPPIPVAIPQETSSSSNQVRHPLFWGTGRSLFGIFIVNTFFTLITLGIYSFWGRARIREFLNSQTSFTGSRFAYHGTGKELFTGWMKAMLVFGFPYLFLSSLQYFWQGIPAYVPQAIAGMLVLCFIPVAVVGAHRYRLSRTSLRNIRFSFRGTISDYTKLWLKGSVLTVLTLGIYYPFFENARRHYLVTNSQFGSRAFDYDGKGKGLLAIYSKATGLYLTSIILLGGVTLAFMTTYLSMPITDMKTILYASGSLPIITIIALIIPWFYLQAARQRFFWNHTRFGDARFISTVTTWKIFELRLGHLFLLVSTLGMAWPWVQVRNLQFFYYYTGLQGSINFHRVEQDALDASPTGEELAGFFDTGFDLG